MREKIAIRIENEDKMEDEYMKQLQLDEVEKLVPKVDVDLDQI